MKKILILTLLLLTGCNDINATNNGIDNDINKELKEEVKEIKKEKYIDTNPIINGLYCKNLENRYLVKKINSKFIKNQDIAVLSTFFTNETNISNDYFKNVFNNYYDSYDSIENYKIGYSISFNINEKKYYKQILNIEDSVELYDYVQIYLYDDLINANKSFYSHLEEINENTLITTIKLTGSTKSNLITSPITVGVFTYIESDFDENGLYKGKSLYEITIFNT